MTVARNLTSIVAILILAALTACSPDQCAELEDYYERAVEQERIIRAALEGCSDIGSETCQELLVLLDDIVLVVEGIKVLLQAAGCEIFITSDVETTMSPRELKRELERIESETAALGISP